MLPTLPFPSLPVTFNVYRNLVVLSCSVVFLFTAYNGLMSLQSSLNGDNSLGPTSLSVVSASAIVSCMFTPPLVIAKLGCKKTIVFSAMFYSVYVMANIGATWWTLIPASVLFGAGVAPLWSAKCSYLATIAREQAQRRSETEEVVTNRFFAIYSIMGASSHIWGNLISASLLKVPQVDGHTGVHIQKDRLRICGSAYCNQPLTNFSGHAASMTDQPSEDQVKTLCIVYLICTILPVFVIGIFLDGIPRPRKGPEHDPPVFGLLIATLRQLHDCRQLLLIPITMYSGLAGAFIHVDFSKAYISCSLGVQYVGLIMMVFGISSSVTTFIFSFIMKWVGRLSLFIFGIIINVAIMTSLLLHWNPDPGDLWAFYFLGVLWGMGDCVWHSLLMAFYGSLWPRDQEAAFSNFRLWHTIGHIVGFQWTNFLCIRVKLGIILASLCSSFVGYLVVEVIEYRTAKKNGFAQNTL